MNKKREKDLSWLQKPIARDSAAVLIGIGIGIVTCYAWLLQQDWFVHPVIENAVRATLAVQPTLAPTLMVSPIFPPTAHIVEPTFSDGAQPVDITIIVEYDHIPSNKYLWVVVRIPKVEPAPRWVYPQVLKGLPNPNVKVNEKDTFSIPAKLGDSQKDVGEPFNIVVLLLDEEANRSFVEYSNQCISNNNLCLGRSIPETGAEILDFVTVIRK